MKAYVSHFSAALEWNIPFFDCVYTPEFIAKRKEDSRLDYTFSEKNAEYYKKDHIVHYCGLELPRNAIIKRNGQYIASPELVFLQLANELDMQRLILLGILMCFYKVGKSNDAVTTRRKLEILLSKTKGHKGHSKAVQALRYIRDGAASINEVLLYMILTLPHSMGGFALTGAVFNKEVLLDRSAQRHLRQKKCFLDIYYPEERIDVEYDSYKHHKDAKSQSKDAERSAVLEMQGIEVFHVYTKQLYTKESFDNLVTNLARRLGRRIRIRTDKFKEAHKKLRKVLPTENDKIYFEKDLSGIY